MIERTRILLSRPQVIQKHTGVAVIGHYNVCSDANQAIAFPRIWPTALVAFVTRHGNRGSLGGLDVVDLHISIAEAQQSRTSRVVFAEDAFNDHLLREVLKVVTSTINVPAKEWRQAQQFDFFFDIDFVGAAGEIQRDAACLKLAQQFDGTRNRNSSAATRPVRSPSRRWLIRSSSRS